MATLGGYGAVDGSASLSGSSTGGRDFLDISQTIATAGDLETFNIYLNTAQPGGEALKLKVWRLNGANYDFIGESQSFSSLSVGANTGLTLTTPIAVQTGDIIGVYLSNNGSGASHKIDVDANTGFDTVYQSGDATTSQATSGFTTLSDFSICVEVFGIVAGADTTPDAFSFTDQTDVALSTLLESNTITVTGIDAAATITVTGGEMSINSGAYTSTSTTVSVNDTVQLRQTSSASNSTQTDVILDIGGVSDTWSITTVSSVPTFTSRVFKNKSGGIQANITGIHVVCLDLSTRAVLHSSGGNSNNGSGILTITDAAFTAGVEIGAVYFASDGSIITSEKVTPV